jgi:ribosome-binding factor A
MAQYRAARLGHEIQRFVAEMLQTELRDPRLLMTTVTRVEVSSDLRHAKVYVSTVAPEDREQAAQALRHARGFLRSRLAARLNLRTTPDLHFLEDKAIIGGDQVLGILRHLEEHGAEHDGR